MATPVDGKKSGDLDVFTSGQAQKVDLRSLEKELMRLWKSAAEAGDAGVIQPVTRAAVVTLVLVVHGDEAAALVTARVARVTEHSPCRAILVNIQPGETDTPLQAWASAHCHRVSGGRQVCCEQVTILATPSGVDHAAGVIVPLLIPDLPVFLYWPDLLVHGKGGEETLYGLLSDNADYLVVDSARAADSIEAVHLMEGVTDGTAYSQEPRDLNWSRLLPWREALADVFEPPDMRSWLRDVRRIEVHAVDGSPTPGGEASPCPVRPIYLLSWLADRLRWNVTGGGGTGGAYDVAFDLGRAARITLEPGEGTRGTLRRIVFDLAGDRRIEVERSSENQFSAMIRKSPGDESHCSLPRNVDSEESLLCEELDHRGPDPVFKAALAGTSRLLAGFHGGFHRGFHPGGGAS